MLYFFFFNDPATPKIYPLSLPDALPISWEHHEPLEPASVDKYSTLHVRCGTNFLLMVMLIAIITYSIRSEEHTSELQSRQYLVCRLLLEKKKYTHFFLLTILYYSLS